MRELSLVVLLYFYTAYRIKHRCHQSLPLETMIFWSSYCTLHRSINEVMLVIQRKFYVFDTKCYWGNYSKTFFAFTERGFQLLKITKLNTQWGISWWQKSSSIAYEIIEVKCRRTSKCKIYSLLDVLVFGKIQIGRQKWKPICLSCNQFHYKLVNYSIWNIW